MDPENYIYMAFRSVYLESMMRRFRAPAELKMTHSDLSSSVVTYDIIAVLREPSKPRFIQKQTVNSFREGKLTVST